MVDRLEILLNKIGVITDANPVTYSEEWGNQILMKGEFAGRSVKELVEMYCGLAGKKAQVN